MFWQKLQHHSTFFFFSFVLLAQSLVFVASQALPFKNYQLKATWLSPHSSQTIVIGQSIDLQANIEASNKNIGALYFVLADPDENFVLNFETQKDNAGLYSSLGTWNTADWPSGIYNISARASIIDEQGRIIAEQESKPLWVKLISRDEYNNLTINDATTAISESSITIVGDEDDLGMDDSLASDLRDDTSTSTANDIATSTPDNNATSTADLTPGLELVSPEPNTTISSQSFVLNFLTNFSADNVSFEFINTDNAAISTRAIAIAKTDGYSWVKNIQLDDTFINGSYKLILSSTIPDSDLAVLKTFDYALDIPSQIKPEDLMMNLVNLQSNVQGQVGLRAEANLRINNLDFVIEDSISHVEALRIAGINNSSASSTGANFLAVWDSAVLANGNYLVYVESKIDQQKVGSTKQLVTTYNPNNDNQVPEVPEVFAPAGGPNIITTPTSTVSVADSLIPDLASSIDCQRSGITDQSLCRQYQAELNDSLPKVCREKNIFDSAECEKNIFESTSDICLSQKITDPLKCREYLYSKYSADLSCNISATSTCRQVVSDKYIARLAYWSEEKDKYSAVINDLDQTGLTLNSLSAKLTAANLLDVELPLVASDKKIITAKVKSQSILDIEERLAMSSPLLIMGDNDGDGLPDDLENYYGTDPSQADSDSDGYSDGQEVLNSYNPLGAGPLTLDRTAIDQVLLAKIALEEPRVSSLLADNNWSIAEANSAEGTMKFSGQAVANTWVNIFVYSDIALLATTKADANGQWSYSLADPLVEGVHRVYIASHNEKGTLLTRSEPLIFVVANIKNDMPPVGVGQQINVSNEETVENDWTIYYIIGGSFIFLILVGLILLILKRRRQQQPDGLVSQASQMTASASPETVATEIKLSAVPAQSPEPEVVPNTIENKDQENHA